MSIHSDTGFSSGAYTVTRSNGGTVVLGRFVRATPSVFTIDAAEYPDEGRTDEDQPEGQTTSETRTLYTDVELFTTRESSPVSGVPGVGLEADLVEIDGDQWVVSKVKHYKVLSGHFVVTVERLNQGKAA